MKIKRTKNQQAKINIILITNIAKSLKKNLQFQTIIGKLNKFNNIKLLTNLKVYTAGLNTVDNFSNNNKAHKSQNQL